MNDLTRESQKNSKTANQVIDVPDFTGDRFSTHNDQPISHSNMFKRNFQTRGKDSGGVKPKRGLELNYKSLMTDKERKGWQYSQGM